MAMFGKGSASSREAIPGLPELSFADRAAIFGGAMLNPALGQMIKDRKTIIPAQREYMTQLGERVRGTPERQVQMPVGNEAGQDISAAFSPQMRTQPGKAPLAIGDADLPSLALRAQQLGIPIDGLLDVLKAQQPDVRFDRGYGYNGKTGAPTGGFHTELDKGMRPGAGGVVENAPGYVNSASEAAGAVTKAQEGAKAGFDVITIDMPDGSKQQLPRDVAVQAILQSLLPPPPPPPGSKGPAATPAPPVGRSRTPEATALATGRATNTVKQEGAVGDATVQAQLDLPKVRDQAQNTLNVLDKIRKHPSLPDRTGNSTLLPALRPRDVDFDVMVSQIGGGAFLEAVQSLKGSGQITEIEGKKATDAIARMQNQRQSQAGFMAAMKDYEDIVRRGLSRTERRAGGTAAPAPSVSRWTPEAARAELARRRQAQGR